MTGNYPVPTFIYILIQKYTLLLLGFSNAFTQSESASTWTSVALPKSCGPGADYAPSRDAAFLPQVPRGTVAGTGEHRSDRK